MTRAAAATASGYRRVQSSERSLHAGPLGEAWAAFQGLLPLGREAFGRRLAAALSEARRRGSGFYLGGFPARRALGPELLIEVDPRLVEQRLEHRVAEGSRVYLVRDRFLGAGDWNPLLTPLRSASTYREVEAVVRAGLDYRATDAYRSALERAGGAHPLNRNFVALDSPERVDTYFKQTAELCRSIREHGVRRRSAQGRHVSGNPRTLSVRRPWVEWGEADIGVAVGADGTIYRFASGKHRTAAAKSLGLPSMPVEVRMVHADWLGAGMRAGAATPLEALVEGVRGLGLPRG